MVSKRRKYAGLAFMVLLLALGIGALWLSSNCEYEIAYPERHHGKHTETLEVPDDGKYYIVEEFNDITLRDSYFVVQGNYEFIGSTEVVIHGTPMLKSWGSAMQLHKYRSVGRCDSKSSASVQAFLMAHVANILGVVFL